MNLLVVVLLEMILMKRKCLKPQIIIVDGVLIIKLIYVNQPLINSYICIDDNNYITKYYIMAETNGKTLTSVKVKTDLWEEFRIECLKRKFSFQKLSDRAIYLYLTDEDFRRQITNQTNLELNKD